MEGGSRGDGVGFPPHHELLNASLGIDSDRYLAGKRLQTGPTRTQDALEAFGRTTRNASAARSHQEDASLAPRWEALRAQVAAGEGGHPCLIR